MVFFLYMRNNFQVRENDNDFWFLSEKKKVHIRDTYRIIMNKKMSENNKFTLTCTSLSKFIFIEHHFKCKAL